MNKSDIKIGGVNHHLNYFWENFKVSFKQATEYKANLFSCLLENTIYFLVTIIFGYVLFENIFQVPNFGFKEFILLAFILNIQSDIIGLFWYGSASSLDNLIKSGDLSMYLNKPINTFFGFLFLKRFNPVIFSVYDIMLFVPILSYYFDFEIVSVIKAIGLMIIFIIFGIIFIQFLVSFSWVFIEARRILLYQLYHQGILMNIGRIPMFFFDKTLTTKIFFSGFYFYYISMWIVPLLTTNTFTIEIYEIIMLFIVFIISIIGIVINWKYGLKRYEAFG